MAEKKKKQSKKEELDKKNQEIENLTIMCKRIQADFVNYKERTERETKQLLEFSSADMIRKILPVLDSFELAFKNNEDFESFKKGIELVYAQLNDILKQEGLTSIAAQGLKFDPYKHEVLMKEKSDKEEDIVLEELQKGYELKGKILRHSKVKISG
ncbi:nucleotide exchange factor GrpE [archaeon]|jgi:molecular chaperone GrpE|nr:nucleotide exchange factor GrpE [archaeon]MBT4021909.1 nucleotide exchange factor GrpE [archaeon]MBT4272204.1 nucleotide exchange factor GrpE [archaeon]MBT4461726.1 nucleotide exchange factor GrpE [archaeon]MBT4858234.1 nucleotide exchange factor GrpE [archaeon]